MARPRTIPRADPFVKALFARINNMGVGCDAVETMAGLGVGTLRNWRKGHTPCVHNLQAALNAVGLELTVRPK